MNNACLGVNHEKSCLVCDLKQDEREIDFEKLLGDDPVQQISAAGEQLRNKLCRRTSIQSLRCRHRTIHCACWQLHIA
jgi:hypothetical protein